MFSHEAVTGYPAGSARLAVSQLGDSWHAHEGMLLSGFPSRMGESIAMRVQEELRRAGATPAERVRLFERRQQINRGEVLS